MADARELLLARLEPCVGARALPGGDVTDVRDEGELAGVQVIDQRFEAAHLALRVRRIAHEGEGKCAGPGRRRSARSQQNENQGQTTFSGVKNVVCP